MREGVVEKYNVCIKGEKGIVNHNVCIKGEHGNPHPPCPWQLWGISPHLSIELVDFDYKHMRMEMPHCQCKLKHNALMLYTISL